MSHRLEAIEGNILLLQQAADLLRRIDDQTYATAGRQEGHSPVGIHFRHVLDHYHNFFAGLPEGLIDYDARERHVPLETGRELALAAALGYQADLTDLPRELGARPVRISLRSVADRDEEPDWSESSIGRELQFLVSHTVHHFALIRQLLARAGVETAEGFGVAPSTLAALQREAECAR